jgi:hypothetical protein
MVSAPVLLSETPPGMQPLHPRGDSLSTREVRLRIAAGCAPDPRCDTRLTGQDDASEQNQLLAAHPATAVTKDGGTSQREEELQVATAGKFVEIKLRALSGMQTVGRKPCANSTCDLHRPEVSHVNYAGVFTTSAEIFRWIARRSRRAAWSGWMIRRARVISMNSTLSTSHEAQRGVVPSGAWMA